MAATFAEQIDDLAGDHPARTGGLGQFRDNFEHYRRDASIANDVRASTSKASVNRPSPASVAIASP